MKKAFDHVAILFDKRYGSDLRQSEEEFCENFEKKLVMDDGAIIK